MFQIASLSLVQGLKVSMSDDTLHFDNTVTQAVIKFFFPCKARHQRKFMPSDRNMHHSMPPSKNWVSQFKHGDFSICDVPCPGQHKTVTTSDIIDKTHELIFKDSQILCKSIAEQLGISSEHVGSIIHEDLDMWNLSARWVLKCLKADQKRQQCQSSEQLLELF